MRFRGKFGMVAGLWFASLAGGQTLDEYQVKAGFVSSFANFVEWPPEVFDSPRDPVRICVLGRNPFGQALESLVQRKVVDGRDLTVREISEAGQAGGCHILFIASSERLRFRSILARLENRSIFTIGDTNDFIAEGGVANLRVDDGKVRIEINSEAAKKNCLRISSRLMRLAKIVK
jgi:hypothetical protein